ncbi:hypothetical protein HIM_09636 [Hirsutella minnesotensis 3608]|uniref:EamA domain-containing protein n=1 Tax=Hirsutella minnesotensis 3608 TaxID=1043627 RepID=A0A0F7ZGJ1_9HYPO|nr:hypothetical protein HIM_09636 [Hirsutella minnesotensis 3608]
MPRPTSEHLLEETEQAPRARPSTEAFLSSPERSRSPAATTCNLEQPDARAIPNLAGGRGPEASRLSDASDPDGIMTDPGSGRKGRRVEGSGDAEASAAELAAASERPGLRRNGRSGTPLLYKAEDTGNGDTQRGLLRSRTDDDDDDDDERAASLDLEPGDDPRDPLHRPTFSRQSTMHSRAPLAAAAAASAASARKKYSYAAVFLAIGLVTFAIQTELSAHIQHDLGWDKAYCMMYFTHGSWIVLYPAMLLVLRMQKLKEPWPVFWRRHKQLLSSTVAMIELQTLDVFSPSVQRRARPMLYLIRTTAFITSALTIASLSWYVAVSLTTPSDLTAIYNCSAFFAYLFSVTILREPLRLDKSVAVFIAIIGVLVVAYGDTGGDTGGAEAGPGNEQPGAGSRFAGNLRYACPPEGVSPGRGTIFANTFGACIGLFTLTVIWIPLPILHMLNIEKFELPAASTGWLVLVAVLANVAFSGSFLVLISLTSPVLSSVAALLTIFIVALADWFLTGQPLSWAAIIGGSMIIVAFVGLSWSTYREMAEHEARKLAVDLSDSDEDADLSPSDH